MPALDQILSADCCAVIDASSRKRALQELSELAASAHPEISADNTFDALMARERLGSTALGEGVAIPHCRSSCEHIIGAFVRLQDGVDFDAPDSEPVDLIFILVVPQNEEAEHLALLSTLSMIFSDDGAIAKLRRADSNVALHQALLAADPAAPH